MSGIIDPNATIEQQAIQTLDNMEVIARADMMQRGCYLTEEPVVPERQDSVCGGHRACAYGSLMLGAGCEIGYITMDAEDYSGFTQIGGSLPNVAPHLRHKEFEKRPWLGLAYVAMNVASYRYGMHVTNGDFDSQLDEGLDWGYMEELFESQIIEEDDLADEMVKIIENARQMILAGVVTRDADEENLIADLRDALKKPTDNE